MPDLKELVVFLKLLADETRLRIIHLLSRKEVSVGDLCAALELNQSAVSKHLVKLRLMGMANDVRDGNFIIYSLSDQNAMHGLIIEFLMKNFSKGDVFKNDWERLQKIANA